jgi:protein-arginine kinase
MLFRIRPILTRGGGINSTATTSRGSNTFKQHFFSSTTNSTLGLSTTTTRRPSFRESVAAASLAAGAVLAFTMTYSSSRDSSSVSAAPQDSGISILDEINQRLIRLEDAVITYGTFLGQVEAAKKSNPNNLAAKHFDPTYFHSLKPELKYRLYRAVKSGAENPDSSMGCYALYPDDYEVLKPFFDPAIREYHKIKGEVHHVTNWDLNTVKNRPGFPQDGRLDLTKLGLGTTSMRVRVGRNLEKFPLPGAQSKAQRLQMEQELIAAFEKLMADPKYGGTYYSLTPGTKYTVSKQKYDELVKGHVMFKDMADDPYLASAGISNDWPYGRGAYQSADGGFIIWVGEEDHLRIMCMKKGTILNDVFDRLKDACDVVEKITGKFAHSPDYGYVTSCPTNLGTGMRASIHIKVPNLTADGTETKAKAICKPLGLSVRGVGGEHTPIGKDGTIDLSPSARLMITEAEIIAALYAGIQNLLVAENSGGKL